MSHVARRRTAVRARIEKVLGPEIGVALVIAADITAAGRKTFAPRIVQCSREAIGIPLPDRGLPGSEHGVLRIVLVISLAKIGIRPQSSEAVHRIEHPFQREFDSARAN